MRVRKPYAHLDGSTAYYPYAARTGLRRRQQRKAALLRALGLLLVCCALTLVGRQYLLRDGQPSAPLLAPATAESAAQVPAQAAPVAVSIRMATAEAAAPQAEPGGAAQSPAVMPALQALYRRNPDLVGWLTVDGTRIDYPVLQTPEENEYYLRRDFDGNFSLSGSLFLDAKCRIGPPATANWLIYGHNMSSGGMFATLLRYRDPSFYAAHPTLQFSTLQKTSRWQIVAVIATRLDADALPYYAFFDAADAAEWQRWYDALRARALYDTGQTARYGDQLLTLSTCETSNAFTDKRFAVIAKRLD